MPSLKTSIAAALAGSAILVHAAPAIQRRTRNATTPKVIMDNVSIWQDGPSHSLQSLNAFTGLEHGRLHSISPSS